MKKTLLFTLVALFSVAALACDGDKKKGKGSQDDRSVVITTTN